MEFNFFRKKKERFFLVLDIGTEAVKALIFKKNNSEIIILGAATQYFEKYGVFDSKDFEADMIKRAILKAIENLKTVAEQAREDVKKLPVLLGLPANILKARVAWQSFERKKSKEKISKTEREFICQECLKEARKKISQRFLQKSGILPADIQWINQEIIEIKIDGYPVSQLQDYQGEDVAIKILATFLPKYYLENVERVFKDLKLRIFKIVHIAENLPFIWGDKKIDSIFFDIGGELTQIFLVKGGSLHYIDEFEGGGKMFSLRLSDALGIEEELTKDLKERYTKRSLSAGTAERIKQIFLPEKKIWYENFKLKTRGIKSIGSNIFLFGGGSLLPEIQWALKEERKEVKFIYPKDFKNIEDRTEKLKNPQYTPSLLITLENHEEIF